MPSTTPDILAAIVDRHSDAGLTAVSQATTTHLSGLDDCELRRILRTSGAIPERYGHDSREEKAYGKAADTLVATVFERLGFQTTVVTARANQPDVVAVAGCHRVVVEVKTARLSRTAINPKDFKIPTVATWRNQAGTAVLVAPCHVFPGSSSRLWREAQAHNVALLGFDHLDAAIATRNPLAALLSTGLSYTERLAALNANRRLSAAHTAGARRRIRQELEWAALEHARWEQMDRNLLLDMVRAPLSARQTLLAKRAAGPIGLGNP